MSNIVTDNLDELLAAEIAESFKTKDKPAGGKKYWEQRIQQSDLPDGTSTFRILPLPNKAVPWLSWYEHKIGNKTDLSTPKKFVSFNCPGKDTCEACQRLLPQLSVATHIKGADVMAKEGKAKKQFAVAVIFESWGGKAVPAEYAGPKAFVYGLGVHKGSDRTTPRNILGLAQQHQARLWSTEEGMTCTITKSGSGMLTNYVVDVVQSMQSVSIGGKSTRMMLPTLSPLPNMEEVLANLPDLEPFARIWTPEEISQKISDIDPLRVAGTAVGADRYKVKAAPTRTIQDEVESDSNIPF